MLEISVPRAGWLGVDGKYYPCSYFEHYNVAYEILIDLLHYEEEDISQPDDMLEKMGWLRIAEDGNITSRMHKAMTQSQIDKLWDFIQMPKADERWKKNMARNLEYNRIFD